MPRVWNEIVVECDPTGNNPAQIKCLEAVFANLVSALVSLATLALFVMLITGGFSFLTAGGDAKKAEKARSTMVTAIFGIVAMILSFIILQAIKWFTGVDVLQFKIPRF